MERRTVETPETQPDVGTEEEESGGEVGGPEEGGGEGGGEEGGEQ
jgi:hypothetical protein